MSTKRTVTYSASGPITLADLRKLVEASKDGPDDARVRVKEYRSYSPVDFDLDKIEVSYEV